MRAAVLTVSTRAAAGVYADDAGPAVADVLREAGFEVLGITVIADGRREVAEALIAACASADLVVTNGGTGCTPKDLTPEATRDVIDREVPGLGEGMRAASLRDHPDGNALPRHRRHPRHDPDREPARLAEGRGGEPARDPARPAPRAGPDRRRRSPTVVT